jgi:fatty acid desaturase
MENAMSRALFKEGARIARQKSEANDFNAIRDLSLFVFLIFAAYGLLIWMRFDWLAVVVAYFLVAKGQNGLLLSGHEAIHNSLFHNKKLNDLIGTYLCFAPLGVGYNRARAAHLDHHIYLLTERDEKLDQQIENPTRLAFLAHLFLPLLGAYLFKGLLRILGWAPSRRAKPAYHLSDTLRRRDRVSIIISNLVLLTCLTAIDWRFYLLFWVGPLLTVTAFFHNAKAFLDHARLSHESESEKLFSYKTAWFDHLFFGTQQARHAEHHLYPHVPYYRLSEVEHVVRKLPTVQYRGSYTGFLFAYYGDLARRNRSESLG